jgi:hypothetical protein
VKGLPSPARRQTVARRSHGAEIPLSAHLRKLASRVPFEIGIGVCGASTAEGVFGDRDVEFGAKEVVCCTDAERVPSLAIPLAAELGTVGVDELRRTARSCEE